MRSRLARWWRERHERGQAKSFFAGMVAAVAIATLGAVLFIQSGFFAVAASKPHTRLVYWMTHTTMVRSVRHQAGDDAPPAPFTRAQIVAGFCAYEVHCVTCHGALSVGRAPWVNGMTPDPPYLADAPREWTPAQLHWIIKNGVKMTAMPAWEKTLSDREIWNLVAFLETAPNRKPGTYVAMRAANLCAPVASRQSPSG